MTISKYAIGALLMVDVVLVGSSIFLLVGMIHIALDPELGGGVVYYLLMIGAALFPILQVAATIFFMKYATMYRISGGA